MTRPTISSAVLYSALTRLTPEHKPHDVWLAGNMRLIYIRTEGSAEDVDDALTHAHPMDGEIVLNAIPMGKS